MRFMSRPTPALLLAALLLGGCADEQAPAAIPRADGHYVRVVELADGQRSVLEAHVVRNGQARFVAAELDAKQRSKAHFPLARNAVVEMGSCGAVLWTPPANVLNPREWMAVRAGGAADCPIPLHASSWTVLGTGR